MVHILTAIGSNVVLSALLRSLKGNFGELFVIAQSDRKPSKIKILHSVSVRRVWYGAKYSYGVRESPPRQANHVQGRIYSIFQGSSPTEAHGGNCVER